MKIKLNTCAGELHIVVSDGAGRMHSEITREGDDDAYDLMLDGIESLVLAHACAGVNVEDTEYMEGLNTALEAIANA
jgi:hypothetical protein